MTNKLMKAIGIQGQQQPFKLLTQALPDATGHDLLVEIDAIAINPVDNKVKNRLAAMEETPRILGWDAVGTVTAIGEKVTRFKPGDKVFYAGDIRRPGCYASHQLVDERITAMAPLSLTAEQAAAMPLTSITAWEALFSRLKIANEQDKGKTILIIGGAGGVGSIAIQLAKKVANLTVVATASRPESQTWCQQLGADYCINHHQDLLTQYQRLPVTEPDYILCLSDTDSYFDVMSQLIAPEGMICSIVETTKPHDLDLLKTKSAGFVWEFMFTRPMYDTDTMHQQHALLTQIAGLLDNGVITTTMKQSLGPMSVANLTQAHQQIVKGQTIGKITLSALK